MTQFNIENLDFSKGSGLLPAIIQDAQTENVLMLGYMNAESVEKTVNTGLVTFFSRSRQTLWTKGETSGNLLNLVSIGADCDDDTILVRVNPVGPTCHKGTTSCFGDSMPQGLGFLAYLEALIEDRRTADPDGSYTAKLLQGPINRAAQKVGEEGVETAMAAVSESNEKLTSEAADLIYHVLVLLSAKGLKLEDVIDELRTRHQ